MFKHESYDVFYILTYRNPLSIAKSLEFRDGFESTKSYLLWLLHVIPSFIETKGANRILLNFDDLLNDPVSVLRRISNKFKLEVNEHDLNNYVFDFLENELRHYQYSIDDLRNESDCPSLVLQVYTLLEKVNSVDSDLDSFENLVRKNPYSNT